MERDDDIKGQGNSYDFGARMYDNRLGKWWSVDPLSVKYPSLSPYCFVGNMPIVAIDPKGKEIIIVTGEKDQNGAAIRISYKPGMPTEGLNEFTANAVTALNYIHKNGVGTDGVNKVQELVDFRQVMTIEELDRWDRSSYFQPDLHQGNPGGIFFNDNMGDQFTDGIQSPAVALAHELDHAWKFIGCVANYDSSGEDRYWDEAMQFAFSEPNSEYRVNEELRVVNGLENIIAKSLSQSTRSEYNSPNSIYYTNDVIGGMPSTAPSEIQEQIETTNKKMSDKD